ncbi:MAG TPA: hypothetical protein VNI02_14365 [Blastocatellia bacterium]|nr:hypothetical protein [Blastocatellia bacterium]
MSNALQPAINSTAPGGDAARVVKEFRFAFIFFSFSAANGAGGAMV